MLLKWEPSLCFFTHTVGPKIHAVFTHTVCPKINAVFTHTVCPKINAVLQSLTRNTAIEVASTVKALYNETESLLLGRVSLVSSEAFMWTPFFSMLPSVVSLVS